MSVFSKSTKNSQLQPKTQQILRHFDSKSFKKKKLYLETIISCPIFIGPK